MSEKRKNIKMTKNLPNIETPTNGGQHVYVERNHDQKQTPEKQKRDFVSKGVVEPASHRWPQNEPEPSENLQASLKNQHMD